MLENNQITSTKKTSVPPFTQVFPKGWRRIRELSIKNSGAAGLYAFFAEHIDFSCGAVVCDQQFLADQMMVTTRTIHNWLKFLEQEQAILRIPVSGRVYAYALDPYEVWKGFKEKQPYAAFITKTLTNKNGEIQRRLQAMFSKKDDENQTDLEDFTNDC